MTAGMWRAGFTALPADACTANGDQTAMPTKPLHPKSTRMQRGEGMTGAAYRRTLARLDMTQVGAASFFGVSDRTGRQWLIDGPPLAVAYTLRIMVKDGKWTAQAVAKL